MGRCRPQVSMSVFPLLLQTSVCPPPLVGAPGTSLQERHRELDQGLPLPSAPVGCGQREPCRGQDGGESLVSPAPSCVRQAGCAVRRSQLTGGLSGHSPCLVFPGLHPVLCHPFRNLLPRLSPESSHCPSWLLCPEFSKETLNRILSKVLDLGADLLFSMTAMDTKPFQWLRTEQLPFQRVMGG